MNDIKTNKAKWYHAVRIWFSFIMTYILVLGICWAITVIPVIIGLYYFSTLEHLEQPLKYTAIVIGGILSIFAQIVSVKLVLTQKYKKFEIHITENHK